MIKELLTRMYNLLPTRNFIRYRYIQAAQRDRLTGDWNPVSMSADAELRDAIRIVRNRARDLEHNDDYAKRFLKLDRVNVPGPNGFILQAKVRKKNGDLDEKANNLIEEKWEEFCEDCSVTGNIVFRDFTHLARLYQVRDGESIVRIVKNYPNNKYKFALEMIDPDYLDETYIDVNGNNRIRLGVEYDKWNRPVAYHMFNIKDNSDIYSSYRAGERIRIPAEEIIHTYQRQRITQSRGISRLVQSILRLYNLSAYEKAAIVNARIGASKMAFIETSESDDGYEGETDERGNATMSIEPGVIERLNKGEKVTTWDPQFPETQHGPFVKTILRGVASGLGLSYNTLANDLENVSYSSIRAGLLEERDMWVDEQKFMIDNFINPIYKQWIEWCFKKGIFDSISGYKVSDLFSAQWQGKRWQWVDPLKDITANVSAINNGLKTRAQVISEINQNADIYEHFEAYAAEVQLLEELKLNELLNPKQKNKGEL